MTKPKPKLKINTYWKEVELEGRLLKLSSFSSPIEFANHIVEKYEYLWDADTCNDTRKELVNLYNALIEA